MILNVAQFLKSEIGTIRHVNFEDTVPPLSEQVELEETVRGTVELIRTNRGILARANLTTAVRLECSRCLENFVDPLPINFSEEFVPVVDVDTGAPTNIPHESYTYLIDDRHEMDLSEAIREYGLLELPMKPLCAIDCAGLCPQCGSNRNNEPCTCAAKFEDGRFAALRALLAIESDQA